jgi:UDP-GlcNAc:undecaprenyl-phosphate GlcNAc-1-phosphate transferase
MFLYKSIILIFLTNAWIIFAFLYKEKITRLLGIYDKPDSFRKIHEKPISKIGGLIIFFTIVLNIVLFPKVYYYENNLNINYTSVLFITYFFLIGLLDDLYSIKPYLITVLIIIGSIIFLNLDKDLVIRKLTFYEISEKNLELKSLSFIFTIFSIYIFYNSVNFSDGANGILASLSIFWLTSLFFINLEFVYFITPIIFCLILLLLANIKNKLFFGNSGSSTLSAFVALIYIKSYNNNYILLTPEIIFLLFLLPGLDCVVVTVKRLINKKNPLKPDNSHFHHNLINLTDKKYVWVIYILIAILPVILFISIKNYFLTLGIFISIYIFFHIFIKKIKRY